ncbi:MAG: hypothetical protein JNJ59_20205, partial [Deltaproteobacteria bacterium]|nr:hypothetical protein [Deltaproteobacteria bacterium]
PASCEDASCVSLTSFALDGAATSHAIRVPGVGSPRLVSDPAGGVIVTRGDLAVGVVHVATDGTATERAWPVGAGPGGHEHWVTSPGSHALWRCAVGQRALGPADHRIVAVDGIACSKADGTRVNAPACARGLVCDDLAEATTRGIVSACGGRVRFDPETAVCALAPAFEAADPGVVTAPDGVRFRIVEDASFEAGETDYLHLGFPITGIYNDWRLERVPDNGAEPVTLARGYRVLRRPLSGAPLDPALTRPLHIVAGIDAIAVLEEGAGSGDGARGDAKVVARVVREDRDGSAPVCGEARCGPSASCVSGRCVCPPETETSACLGAPGSPLAPAPSCQAVGHVGLALIDPDGREGPFPADTLACEDVPGLGLATVGADRITTGTAVDPPAPNGCSGLQPMATVHGAFAVTTSFPPNPLSDPSIALDGPELSPTGDGLGAWDTTTCGAPGRLVVGVGKNEFNQDVLEVRVGGRVLHREDNYTAASVEVRRDALGTITILRDGVAIYSVATGKLAPLRFAARVPVDRIAWAGSRCLAGDNAWPSAPSVCDCTPVDCGARHADCGPVDDGCGRVQPCGGCSGQATCEDNVCVPASP